MAPSETLFIGVFIDPLTGIPTLPDGGNHTRAFADSAATVEAHQATLNVSKSLAAVGMRVLTDEAFLHEVSTLSNCRISVIVRLLLV